MMVEGSVTDPGFGIGFGGHEIYWHLMYIRSTHNTLGCASDIFKQFIDCNLP
jgi:hypothetical protein